MEEAPALSFLPNVSTLGPRICTAVLLRILMRAMDETVAVPGVWSGSYSPSS